MNRAFFACPGSKRRRQLPDCSCKFYIGLGVERDHYGHAFEHLAYFLVALACIQLSDHFQLVWIAQDKGGCRSGDIASDIDCRNDCAIGGSEGARLGNLRIQLVGHRCIGINA